MSAAKLSDWVPLPVLVGVGVGAVALVGVALVGRYAIKKAGESAYLVNPADSRNIVYDGIVGGIGRAVSGDPAWTLGGWIYDLTHDEIDLTKPTPPKASRPVSPEPNLPADGWYSTW